MRVDTVGVRNLTQADTTSDYEGLVIIDRQFTFPRNAQRRSICLGILAESFDPIKLIIVQVEESGELVEVLVRARWSCPSARESIGTFYASLFQFSSVV